MSSQTETLPWPAADSDPVSERIVSAAGRLLLGLPTLGSKGVRGTLNVGRATTDQASVSTADLSTLIWVDDPKAQPAPWGQQGWRQDLEVCTYVREDEAGGVPIDRRLNIVAADVQAALAGDLRLGGLLFVDSAFGDTIYLDGGETGVSSCRVYLRCEYRTLRDNPYTLAPGAGDELLFQGGATLYIGTRSNPYGPAAWRTYANVRVVPMVKPDVEQINADGGGQSRPAHVLYAGHEIRYEVEVGYVNADLIARQVGGGPAVATTQVGGTYAAVPIAVAAVDSVVPLHDGSGLPVYGVTAVAAVTSRDGAVAYALGVDYATDPAFLQDGMLKVPAGSSIPPGSAVLVTFTAPSQLRPSIAAGVACSADVLARVVWSAADGLQMVHDDPANGGFNAALMVTSTAAAPGQPTTAKLTLTATENGSATPLGRYLMPAGPMPAGY